MLVLSRERGETVNIGDEIEVTVIDIRGDKVRLGVNAPRHVAVHRKEVYEAIKRQQKDAAAAGSAQGGAPEGAASEASQASVSPDQSTSVKAPPTAPPAT